MEDGAREEFVLTGGNTVEVMVDRVVQARMVEARVVEGAVVEASFLAAPLDLLVVFDFRAGNEVELAVAGGSTWTSTSTGTNTEAVAHIEVLVSPPRVLLEEEVGVGAESSTCSTTTLTGASTGVSVLESGSSSIPTEGSVISEEFIHQCMIKIKKRYRQT